MVSYRQANIWEYTNFQYPTEKYFLLCLALVLFLYMSLPVLFLQGFDFQLVICGIQYTTDENVCCGSSGPWWKDWGKFHSKKISDCWIKRKNHSQRDTTYSLGRHKSIVKQQIMQFHNRFWWFYGFYKFSLKHWFYILIIFLKSKYIANYIKN